MLPAEKLTQAIDHHSPKGIACGSPCTYDPGTMRQPQMTTLDTLAVQERRLYLNAEKRLGDAYIMAREATLLLTMFTKSVSYDRAAFINYIAQLKAAPRGEGNFIATRQLSNSDRDR